MNIIRLSGGIISVPHIKPYICCHHQTVEGVKIVDLVTVIENLVQDAEEIPISTIRKEMTLFPLTYFSFKVLFMENGKAVPEQRSITISKILIRLDNIFKEFCGQGFITDWY